MNSQLAIPLFFDKISLGLERMQQSKTTHALVLNPENFQLAHNRAPNRDQVLSDAIINP